MSHQLAVTEWKCPKCGRTNLEVQGAVAAGAVAEGGPFPNANTYTLKCLDCDNLFCFRGPTVKEVPLDGHSESKVRETEDQLLGPGEDADTNAMLWWRGDERWAAYTEGYKKAADILVERVIETASDQDFLLYPIAFLYRHYLELRLKTLVRVGYRLVGEPSPPSPEHRLPPLWNKARVLLERVWPKGPKSDLDKVEACILEFADKDPKSEAFRYPTTNRGKQTLSGLTQINLRNCQQVMGRLAILLDSAFDGLTEMLRIKREARDSFV